MPKTERPPGVGFAATVEGLALVVWHLLATPFIGRRRLRWGTIGSEPTDRLPGDDLVPSPKWTYTLGMGIAAPPEEVWPWVAQIGQRRAGFYSYQGLENMAGCRIANTATVLPEHQHPVVGGEIYLHPTAPPMRIEVADPPSALVLFGSPAEAGTEESWGMSTWQFVLRPGPTGSTRLLTRGRSDYTPDWKNRLAYGRFPIEAITFVMSRKMMLGIKSLSEQR